MGGGNFTNNMNCPLDSSLATFERSIGEKIWQVNALLATEAVLAAIIVGIGAYGQRYRHHPFTRFIFLGATTLFLPIVSSVVSTVTVGSNFVKRIEDDYRLDNYVYNNVTYVPNPNSLSALVATCNASGHFIILIVWALLIQIVMVNTSTVAATEDREGQSAGPPFNLIVQGVWTIYLGFTIGGYDMFSYGAPFSILCAKIVLKYYAFEKARRSFALGRNPGLTFVYMEKLQLQEANHHQHSEEPQQVAGSSDAPPLLVMREEEKQVEIQPHGYAFKDDDSGTLVLTKKNNTGPVTFDRVWQLDDSTPLPISTPKLKGLCLSFALFKLLRCRFSRYNLTNNAGSLSFFRSFSLQPGEHDRIFRVIVDELSFVNDYYFSSLPISYAKCCLPILNILLSLLSIAYCIYIAAAATLALPYTKKHYQIGCNIWHIQEHLVSSCGLYSNGRFFFDVVLLLLLPVLVLTVEVKDMVSYICSNWTKVALICRYVNHASSPHYLGLKKWAVSLLLRCRCKIIMKHWDEEISQCSVLVPHQRTTLLDFIRCLNPFQDKKWKVKVTTSVKGCIIDALRSVIVEGLSNDAASLRRSQVGESFLWACEGKATSETILVWHIATCILQLKPPHRHDHGQAGCTPISSSDHKTVAIQLSQYCAYLVSRYPELLPDNNAWCKSLYKAVQKDAKHAVTECSAPGPSTPEDECAITESEHPVPVEESSTPEDERAVIHIHITESSTQKEAEYQKLIRLLSENSKHEVLKNGVKLGKQLVETTLDGGEETAWKLLAGFWSEMVLYVAPSDNLKGHKEAIARGGELITLLWALLFHAGIVSRPGEEDGTAPTTSCAGAI